jgi:putative membrane protein
MKQLLLIGVLAVAAIVVLIACGGGTSVNVNTNSIANSAGNAANAIANLASTAANSISNTASSTMTASPESFAKDAAQAGMAEVKIAQLAAKNAKDPEVKKFAQMMVTDHGKANDELKALAAKKNYQLPTDIGSHQSAYDKLSKLNGADFDKEYVDDMVSGHESVLKDFQRQADNGTDPDVKAFAAKYVPVVQKHLDAIKAIQAKMNSGSSSTSSNTANTKKK